MSAIFRVVKTLAKLATTWKMLNGCLLWSCVTFFEFLRIFWEFLWCFWTWTCVILWYCPYYNWEFWLWVPCTYFYRVIKVLMWSVNCCFGMHAYIWWLIRGAVSGEEEGRRPPLPFFENSKNCLNNGKKCPDCFHPWIKCSSMLSFKRAPMFWEYLGGKTPKLPPPSDFFYML